MEKTIREQRKDFDNELDFNRFVLERLSEFSDDEQDEIVKEAFENLKQKGTPLPELPKNEQLC